LLGESIEDGEGIVICSMTLIRIDILHRSQSHTGEVSKYGSTSTFVDSKTTWVVPTAAMDSPMGSLVDASSILDLSHLSGFSAGAALTRWLAVCIPD
jgi:hypothetical protein